MTEHDNQWGTGQLVPARKMPNLQYPRFTKWYTTKTWISSATNKFQPMHVTSARDMVRWECARRVFDAAGATRSQLQADDRDGYDLTTPYYMLANTDAGFDALIGPDYKNVPLDMAQDAVALASMSIDNQDLGNINNIRTRTLAFKHVFDFVNYSRHPLEVFYTVVPAGYDIPDLNSYLTAPLEDLSHSGYTKMTIPGVTDAGDKGVKRSINLAMNLVKMFPEQYQLDPTIVPLENINYSPWRRLDRNTGNFTTTPPGQEDVNVTTDEAAVPSLRLRWYAKLQLPVYTNISVDPTVGAGDVTGLNGYTVYATSSWLQEFARPEARGKPHPGTYAYPDQTA